MTLSPVWPSIQEYLEGKRSRKVYRSQILARAGLVRKTLGSEPTDETWTELLKAHPKDCLLGLLHALGLRHQPALFADLGRRLSLPELKAGEAAGTIASILVQWFGNADPSDAR